MRVLRLLLLGGLLVATTTCFELAWNAAQDTHEALVRHREVHQLIGVSPPTRGAPLQRLEFPTYDLAALEAMDSTEQEEPKKAEPAPKRVKRSAASPRPLPPVAPENALVPPEDAIRMALRLKRPALERCYNEELKKQTAFDGFIVVAVSLSANGRVTEAHLDEATRRGAQVGTCIVGLLRQLQLPPLTEEVDLLIPIRLETTTPT